MAKGISVIIPAYNREKFIKEAIQSILQQRFEGRIELILCDDGSQDNTVAIAKEFGAQIILLEKPADCKDQGVAPTRNRGLKAATQPYISFLDSDDIYLPSHLERMIEVLEKDPQLGFAFCRSLEFKTEGGLQLFRPWTKDKILKHDIKNPVVSGSFVVNTNCFVFRKEVFDEVGFFDENLSNGEDGDLWMRISEKYKGEFIDHFGSAYRNNHGYSQLTKNPVEKIDSCNKIVFENARKRYHNLKLRDHKRIFKIEFYLLLAKYQPFNEGKLPYYLEYLKLILKYPTGYLQKKIDQVYEKKGEENWQNLNAFT